MSHSECLPVARQQSRENHGMATITTRDLSSMVSHWLGCPVDGYLGSGYGSDIKSLVQTPMASGLADGQIAKCRQDIPLLLNAAPDAVNVYAYDKSMDQKVIVFEVGGNLIEVG